MILYSYYCKKCGSVVEIEKPMSESSRLETCSCGATLIRKYGDSNFITHFPERSEFNFEKDPYGRKTYWI